MTKAIFFQRLSATIQFILGFAFGIALIAGSAAGAGYIYYKRMSVIPQKPLFSEETNSSETTATSPETPKDKSLETTTETENATEIKPELPANAYEARVTWPQGLSLRSEPDINAGRIGGIAYNSKIVILEDTPDNEWQKIRIPWSEQEGWVKGGNTQRITY